MTEPRIKERKFREIKGLVNLTAMLALVLCLVSYHPQDPSFTHYVSGETPVHNLIGTFGSYLSDLLIRLFGLGAYLLPLAFSAIAIKYFVNPQFHITLTAMTGLLGFFFSVLGLLAVTALDVHIYGQILRPGGVVGQILSHLTDRYLNPTGTYVLFTFFLILSLMTLIDFSLASFAGQLVRGARWLFLFVRDKIRSRGDRALDAPEPPAAPPKIPSPPDASAEQPWDGEERGKAKRAKQAHFDFSPPPGTYTLPPLTLLEEVKKRDVKIKRDQLIANAKILERKLSDFGVEGRVTEVRPGPVITMYELEPAPGVKINKITNLSDDLALALKAPSIRILAPIPGKAAIGVEIPNQEREPVHLRDLLDHESFSGSQARLPIALGQNIVGSPVVTDLIRMPHLLVAGTTGSGKSVFLNALLCSILYRATPEEVKFLLIDPKRLELSAYEGIPHLLHPVVVDPKKAAQVLKWAVAEMERRYQIIGDTGAKSIDAYNTLREKPPPGEEDPAGPPVPTEKLPYIVIIIDELADLMMVAQRHVEESLARLAQMARASGIHLILATQRPSVDVITGVIKANFPTRISFQVSSRVDSRTILDQLGAEKLLGYGDMLFIPPGTSKLTRIHGAFVSDREIDRIAEFLRVQGKPAYDDSIADTEIDAADTEKGDEGKDEKYDEAIALVVDLGQASVSLLQRYLKVGYNRAARMIERMEKDGIIGPSDGVKPRKVLVRKMTS